MKQTESKALKVITALAGAALLAAAVFSPVRVAHAATPPTPEELLRSSDRARGGLLKGLTWNITIDSMDDGEKSVREFAVKARDNDALAEATQPSRNKGEIFLFNDRTMWFFKPGLRKPVAISARQKLTGQAANGDIASTHYSRDYTAKLLRMEKVGAENAYVLLLKAKSPNVTYDQIRYWVSEKSQLGVKAEFLTLQGDVFKAATFEYGNRVSAGGAPIAFVSRMHIVDAKFAQNTSTIVYGQPKVESHSPNLFNVNNIAR